MSKPFGKCLAILAVLLSVAGCNSMRLYSDVRDKQSQDAKKAWEAISFDATVKTERTNLASLLAAEIDSRSSLQTYIRDLKIRVIVSSTLQEGLVDEIVDLNRTLIGNDTPGDTLTTWAGARTKPADFGELKEIFESENAGTVSCDFASPNKPSAQMAKALASSDESVVGSARIAMKRLNALCSMPKYDSFEKKLKPGGAAASYIASRDEAITDLEAFKNSAKDLVAAYDNAKKAFDDASKAAPVDKVKNVKAEADKLQAAADALSQSSSPIAQKFISEVNLAAISDFIKAVSETPTDPSKIPANANGAAVALVVIPGLMDEARTAANEQRAIRATPLLMRANFEQLRLDAANRDIASREVIVQLYKDLVECTLAEALQLSQAYRELNLTPVADLGTSLAAALAPTKKPNAAGPAVAASLKDWLNKPIVDLNSKALPDEKQLFYASAGWYLDAVGRLETKRFTILAKIDSAHYERALAYSEINAKQWTSLIGLSVNQIAASASGGIKTDLIIRIINSAGLLWGANGLNKL